LILNSNKKKKVYLQLLSVLFFSGIVYACNYNKKQPSGGPCKYETIIYPAAVIAVDTGNSPDVIFRVKDLSGVVYRDSVSWFKEKAISLTREKIIQESIRMGNRYKYEIMKITSGSCDPQIETLKLEKYKEE
jgi:hypothetical protein